MYVDLVYDLINNSLWDWDLWLGIYMWGIHNLPPNWNMFLELTLYLIICMNKRHIYSQACIASVPWDTVSNQSLAVWKLGQEQNIDGNEFLLTRKFCKARMRK